MKPDTNPAPTSGASQAGQPTAFPLAAGSHLLVWWTTYVDCLFISEHHLLAGAPGYIVREFDDRCGRKGRGRLWVPSNLPQDVEIPNCWRLTRQADERRSAAGIVFERAHYQHLANLPGEITDMACEPFIANEKDQPLRAAGAGDSTKGKS